MGLIRQLVFCGYAILVLGAPVQAVEFHVESLDEPLPLSGVWRFRTGDDPDWASPSYDDGRWDNILLPRSWRKQGYEDLSGIAWYRATVQFATDNPALADELGQLGITLGKIHSAYEFYAGGRLMGTVGKLPPEPEMLFDLFRSFPIPVSAIDDEGRLTLAIRVWRHPDIGYFSAGGAYEGPFVLGRMYDLSRNVGESELPALVLAILYAVFGLYHLYLYRRNPQLPELLWFGLLTIGIAIYGASISQWKHYIDLPFLVLKKIEYVTLYLLPALGLQMLWQVLRFSPPIWARFYQAGFLLLAALVLVWPGYAMMAWTLPLWQIYLLPCLLGTLVQVIWFAANDNREGRTVIVGVALFIGTAFNDLMLDQGLIQSVRLVPWGFAAIIISMAISLANRFTALLNDLEGEVSTRTRELTVVNQQLFEVARTDSLTGLLNRRGFADEVEKEISRSSRSQRSFVLIMADLDDFKACNDRFGHACGDYVLEQVALLLREQSRDVDVLARWGGEEFVLLLPETGLEGGAVLAEKLRGVLERQLFQYQDCRLTLTMTLGVAGYEEGMMLDDCLLLADRALYDGKDSGRNRVQICTPAALA